MKRRTSHLIETLEPLVLMSASGTDGDDTLTLREVGGYLSGGAGDDTLFGIAGGGTLFGDEGDDTFEAFHGSSAIFGGTGEDTVRYQRDRGDYDIRRAFVPGMYLISDGEREDTLDGIEVLQFNDKVERIEDLIFSGYPGSISGRPVIFDDINYAVDEGSRFVGNLVVIPAVNPGVGESLSLVIADSRDGALFELDDNFGLWFRDAPDASGPQDSDQNNFYEVVLRASNGLTAEITVINIGVRDIADSATPNQLAQVTNLPDDGIFTVVEGTSQIQLTTIDPDGSFVSGEIWFKHIRDNKFFTVTDVTASSLTLEFIEPPEFDNPADFDGDNDYNLMVKLYDEKGHPVVIPFTVRVESDTPVEPEIVTTIINAPLGEIIYVPEGPQKNDPLYALKAVQPDGRTLIDWSIVGGADQDFFEKDFRDGIGVRRGAIRFAEPIFADAPVDADNDGVYELEVEASSRFSEVATRQLLRIQPVATDYVNSAPVINGLMAPLLDAATNEYSVDGGRNALLFEPDIFDPDGDQLTYTVTAAPGSGIRGLSQQPFPFKPGRIEVTSLQNAEVDSVREFTLNVTDGIETTSQDFRLRVVAPDGENSAPVFTNYPELPLQVMENARPIYDFDAVDPDGDAVAYTFLNSLGGWTNSNGVYTDSNNYVEGSDNLHSITVVATDLDTGSVRRFRYVVLDRDEAANTAPRFDNLPATLNVDSGTKDVLQVASVDDEGDQLSYTLFGDDAQFFDLDERTGELSFRFAPSADEPHDLNRDNSYDLKIAVDDRIAFATRDLTVVVTGDSDPDPDPDNVAPVFTNLSEGTVFEVQAGSFLALDADATDADGDELTYSIDGGVDFWQFGLDADTGVVQFFDAADPNVPRDANGNNEYELKIGVTDGQLATSHNVIVRVVDEVTDPDPDPDPENVAPEFTNLSEGTVFEVQSGSFLALDADAFDADGDELTFSIDGGVDFWQFGLDADTGVVQFFDVADPNVPRDANGNNEYELQIGVTDGQLSTSHNVIVRVVDAVTDPDPDPDPDSTLFTNLTDGEIVSITEGGFLALTAQAQSPTGRSLRYDIVGGADSWQFELNQLTGELFFFDQTSSAVPRDSDGDNEYELSLQASDGTLTEIVNIRVRVTS